jgi:stress response protein YsnF
MKRLLDKPAEPRQEGDTLIVPLMEEVLVLEKRLLLREELHITRRREQNPHVSPVRREEFEESN